MEKCKSTNPLRPIYLYELSFEYLKLSLQSGAIPVGSEAVGYDIDKRYTPSGKVLRSYVSIASAVETGIAAQSDPGKVQVVGVFELHEAEVMRNIAVEICWKLNSCGPYS